MKPHAISNGQLVQLLTELGFARAPLNERYDLFTESKTDMAFPLPTGDPDAPARATHIDGLRVQLAYRGLMDAADFEAYLSSPVAAKILTEG